MNKELQDLVWAVLPKEFKEEVRTIYAATMRMVDKRENAEQIYVNKLSTLEGIFGFDNLTSDANGEEILHVSRKKLQYFYEKLRAVGEHYAAFALQSLFGSKCLPDVPEDNFAKSEPKQTEPKYHTGDKVVFKNTGKVKIIVNIIDGEYVIVSLDGKSPFRAKESDLEPYVEPIPSNSGELKSQLPGSQLRLKIAAMAMQGLLASPVDANMQSKSVDYITDASFEYADALISKSKKGGLNENN